MKVKSARRWNLPELFLSANNFFRYSRKSAWPRYTAADIQGCSADKKLRT